MGSSRGAVALVACGALAASACSTTPRAYSPVMAAAPADQAAFEAAFNQCSQEVAAGRTQNFREGRGGAVAGGTALGAAAGVVAGASAASGAGMLGGVAAGAGLATGLILVAPIAIIGMSAAKRGHNERIVRDAMTRCLAEEGHTVADWRLARSEDTGPRSPTARPGR
ncbi:hypothetical protein Q0812_07095 [Brevundimonas sp. 2R-24]|uniref:Glycine zipper family protein n=1 Tax=Peiella sedimenti TaxID=3061083 RepID=A0ABT8SPJ0_9CAUL|nr:hypothetical protein [Caulobacteraceae bacterium XZ-24]